MIRELRLPRLCSDGEARDIEEALQGDYKSYSKRKQDFLHLPDAAEFQERLNSSTFDTMNIESRALKYQFLLPFVLKAELNPGLALSELVLTIIIPVICKYCFAIRRFVALIEFTSDNLVFSRLLHFF